VSVPCEYLRLTQPGKDRPAALPHGAGKTAGRAGGGVGQDPSLGTFAGSAAAGAGDGGAAAPEPTRVSASDG
jgi:hypothetical protein